MNSLKFVSILIIFLMMPFVYAQEGGIIPGEVHTSNSEEVTIASTQPVQHVSVEFPAEEKVVITSERVEAKEAPPPCHITGNCPELCQSQEGEDVNGCPTLNCACPPNYGFCNDVGVRGSINETQLYCLGGLWLRQKENTQSCQNSFECKSNFCSNGLCYDISSQVKENTSTISRILDWIRKLFR